MIQKVLESEILAQLRDPKIYELELLSMSSREFRRGYCTDVSNRDAWFNLIDHGKALCKLLAKEIALTSYQPDPIEFREANLQGKKRKIARLSFRDRLVQGAVAQTLHKNFEPIWHERLYSFRRARSNLMALKSIGEISRRHRKKTTIKNQGLFVFRGDVKNYTDSISPKADSKIWPVLGNHLEGGQKLSNLLQQLLMTSGEALPFGSPLTPFFANLYLTQMDHFMNRDPLMACFRYGDDLLALSEEAHLILDNHRNYTEALQGLGLAWNQDKLKLHYWTANGQESPVPEFLGGVSQIEYLGLNLHFRHGLGMSKKHRRRFRAQVYERLANRDLDLEEKWQQLGFLWRDLQNMESETALETAQLYHNQWSTAQIQEERQFVMEEASKYISGLNAPYCYRNFPKSLLQTELGTLWHWQRVNV